MTLLTGMQIGQLQKCVESAFTLQELDHLLLTRIDKQLTNYQGLGDAYPVTIEKVIEGAEREGWTACLLEAILAERPAREDIQSLVAQLLPVTGRCTRSEEPGDPSQPLLAQEIPLVARVHGCSGRWSVRNKFSRWRNIDLQEYGHVYFRGSTYLLISLDGKRGYGYQTGTLYIELDEAVDRDGTRVGPYHAKWEIANEVFDASVDKHGTLRLHLRALHRDYPQEDGIRPKALPGSGDWDLLLNPDPDPEKAYTLTGPHVYYDQDLADYQVAVEVFTHEGI